MSEAASWFKDVPEEWIDRWFQRIRGHGREVATQAETGTIHEYLYSSNVFKQRLIASVERNISFWMSVNFFRDVKLLSQLDKLFFDFDDATNPNAALLEAWEFYQLVERRTGIKGMVVKSGSKGAHYYIWFNPHILSTAIDVEKDFQFLHLLLMNTVCGITGYETTADLARDFKRWGRGISSAPRWKSRVPYSRHPKTSNRVEPVNPDVLHNETPIPKEIVEQAALKALSEYEEYEKRTQETAYRNGSGHFNVRPCIMRAMSEPEPSHYARLAYALDGFYAGKTMEEMVEFFSHFKDYREDITRKQLVRTAEKISAGMKPAPCSRLQEWGLCDESCKVITWSTGAS